MATNRNDRVREMIDEFRVAQQRQLVRRGMTLGNRARAQYPLSLIRQSWPEDSPGSSVWSKLAGHVRAIPEAECGLAGQPVVPCAECGTRSQHPVTAGLRRRARRRSHFGRILRDRTDMFDASFGSALGPPATAAGSE